MPLTDVTAEGVDRAMDEFDQLGRKDFLEKYGFGRARGYLVVRGESRYDSKAIVGAAHGYDYPKLGPLKARRFSGGDRTVGSHLISLGFDVERPPPHPAWAEEELILVLDLYLRLGIQREGDPSVVELTKMLNDLTLRVTAPKPPRSRKPDSVTMKLFEFAAIDPNFDGRVRGSGMWRGGELDKVVWDRYAADEAALDATAASIRKGGTLSEDPPAEPTAAQISKVEIEAAQHVKQFQVSVPQQDIVADRREQSLVLAYRHYLEGQGRCVIRHRYKLPGRVPPVVCDLVDETDCVLYEAKGDVRRTSVRMAIGQLLVDYRHLEHIPMKLAVLLPRRPSQDLVDLIHSVPASVVWRTQNGFESDHPEDATAERIVDGKSH